MEARHHSTANALRRAAIAAFIGFLIVVLVIVYGYVAKPGWVGVSDKNFWDYLQLLIVPAALAIGGYWLNRSQTERDRQADVAAERMREAEAEQREREREAAEEARRNRDKAAQAAQRERELEVESQRAQDRALQAYLDQIALLLLDKDRPLRESHMRDAVRVLARARTLTVLEALDPSRQRSLVRFLYEAELLGYAFGPIPDIEPIVSLGDADLSNCDLSGLSAPGINLSGANLRGANLANTLLMYSDFSHANLDQACLKGADLHFANFSFAQLNGANLSHAELRGADLRSVSLERADLTGAKLEPGSYSGSVSFSDPNLPNAFRDRLVSGRTIGKIADYCYIRTDLANAHLNGANLEGADLSHAVLRGVELREADLSRTNLRGVINFSSYLSPGDGIANEILEEQAKSLRGATMPDGSEPP